MIKISEYAFFAGVAIAVAGAIGGCSSSSSSSPNLVASAAGESCSRTSDCASGLVCIDDECVAKGTTVVNDAGEVIGPDGGIVVVTPDSSVVVPPPAAEAGVVVPPEAAPPPRLSVQGEYCMSSGDCATGLICIPNSPYGGSGVCDQASYGLTASGKTCSGECNMAADCCELPLNTVINGTAVKTCQDILNVVLTGNTTQCTQSPSPTSPIGMGCFYYATYCSSCSTGSTWACTKNQCVYNASCQNSGIALNGCPAVTRTGRALPSTNCDTMSNTCKAAATTGTCVSMDSECDTKATADSSVTCRGGDCTCYQQACYLKCAQDLDCRQGYTCNTTLKLCQQTPGCSTNADCAASTQVSSAQCVSGTCKVPCTSDHQCSPSGLLSQQVFSTVFSGTVCGSDGYCDKLGCSADSDCQNSSSNPGGNTVHLFCVTPPTVATAPVYQSAITN
jgi:hypothetical protein